MQANEDSDAVPMEEVVKRLYDAARSDSWRSGPAPSDNKHIPLSLTSTSVTDRIQGSLTRAAAKTYVRAAKPLRRLLRNQEAVNESLIDAVINLFALTQEMIREISELQRRIEMLEEQLPQPQPEVPPADGTDIRSAKQ